MDQKEYEALLVAIEQMIETSVRGYRPGKHFQILGGLKKTAHEQDRLYNGSDVDSGDADLTHSAEGMGMVARDQRPG